MPIPTPSVTVKPSAPQPNMIRFWVIAGPGGWLTDDNGGNVFVSERMARLVWERSLFKDNTTVGHFDFDDDLAQMCNLYHEPPPAKAS